jgi:hypothetical protein
MSDHEAIERETVRLLVEALKREHGRCYSAQDRAECPVCRLIKRYDR